MRAAHGSGSVIISIISHANVKQKRAARIQRRTYKSVIPTKSRRLTINLLFYENNHRAILTPSPFSLSLSPPIRARERNTGFGCADDDAVSPLRSRCSLVTLCIFTGNLTTPHILPRFKLPAYTAKRISTVRTRESTQTQLLVTSVHCRTRLYFFLLPFSYFRRRLVPGFFFLKKVT